MEHPTHPDRSFTFDDTNEARAIYMSPKEKKENRKNLLSNLFKGRKEIMRRIK